MAVANVFRLKHMSYHFFITSINKTLNDKKIFLSVGVTDKAESNYTGLCLVDGLQDIAVSIRFL